MIGDDSSAELARLHYLSDFVKYVEPLTNQQGAPETFERRDFGPAYPDVEGPTASFWEKRLYFALYARGILTPPQVQVEQYWLDLAALEGDRKLDIEVDGEHYHRAWDCEITRRDQLRNRRMIELGWDVMRFWVYQIRDDLEDCVDRVDQWLEAPR